MAQIGKARSFTPLFNSHQPTYKTISSLIYIIISFCLLSNHAVALPFKDKIDELFGDEEEEPETLSTQAGIAGGVLIICGFILCFFAYRLYYLTNVLIGLYFFGSISYIGMVNGGVESETLLLVVSLVIGLLCGLLMNRCSRIGVTFLGAMAFFALGLWIMGLKIGGTITSTAGRIVFYIALVIVGFIIGILRERETLMIGSAMVGAYSFALGVDMFAKTGFLVSADSFINSKHKEKDDDDGFFGIDLDINKYFDLKSTSEYVLMATVIVMAIIGSIVQYKVWGKNRDAFTPTGVADPDTPTINPFNTTKPTNRFLAFFRGG